MTVATLSQALSSWMLYELQEVGFTYDPVSLRYRNKRTGQYVAEKSVIRLVSGEEKDSYNMFISDSMQRNTQQYINGNLSIQEWQGKMRKDIKDLHIVSQTAGKGGRKMMTQADWGRSGGRLKQQYAYIDSMAWEMESGDLSDAQMLNRARMYSGTSTTAYYDGRTASAKELGFTEERRVLNPAEHCKDCIGYAAVGWQPIGTLPEPGQASQCLSNCKCDKVYRGPNDKST